MIARSIRKLLIMASALLFCGSALLAQSGPGVDNNPGAATDTISQVLAPFEERNPYLGGVPTGTAVPGVLPVSLEGAVQRGLKQNLGVLLSSDTLT